LVTRAPTTDARRNGRKNGGSTDGSNDGFAPTQARRLSSADVVAMHIRTAIFNGELRQGDRLRQDDIGQRLGLSRIPVREAVIALDREGWVSVTPHRGAFVQGIDEDALRDHYELQGLVYGLAARRATERATAHELDALRDAQRRLAGAADAAEVHDANDAFLRLLLGLARSPRLGAVMRNMATVVPGNFFELVAGSSDAQRKGTKRIVTAMRRRDADGAADECGKLLRTQGDLVVKTLAARGLFT
jgi:DNA-binding GntR family transcriptional regulator